MYQLIVGNVAKSPYAGDDEKLARAAYDKYVEMSKTGYGSVGHETVTLMLDGAVVSEYKWTPAETK